MHDAIDTAIDHTNNIEILRAVDIKVSSGVGGSKRFTRSYLELSGRSPNGIKYVVHNNSYINVVRALVERVFFVEKVVNGVKTLAKPPQTSRGYFFNQMRGFSNALLSHLPHVGRMCLEKFVETSPPHKKKAYWGALLEYLTLGLFTRHARVTSFVKAEKVRVTKKDSAPRIIQPRGIVFNLIVGCFIRPAEKAIYKAIDLVFGRPTVVCGQNAIQQAAMLRSAWDELEEPDALSLDLSRMDQHVSEVALRWEHTFYRHLFKNDTCFATLDWCLKQMIHNVGHVYTRDKAGLPKKIKYEKKGSRMSGDMNTSLGNKLIMCGLLYSYYKSYLGLELRKDFNVVDNGDDCVVMLSKPAKVKYNKMTQKGAWREGLDPITLAAVDDVMNERRLRGRRQIGPKSLRRLCLAQLAVEPTHMDVSTWFHTMGFTLKVEGSTNEFSKIEFCQTQPCFIDGRWVMVRGLKALAKDAYCLKPKEYLPKWMAQVKGGGLATYGSVPIYSAYYESLPGEESRNRDLLYGTGMYYLSNGMESSRTITTENRVQFWETFGVTPREQEVIEETYRSMKYDSKVSLHEHDPLLLPLPVI